MSEAEYRLYSFTNMYLSSIQKGIQTAHVVSEMSAIWCENPPSLDAKEVFDVWADQDKTVIVLNGGNQANLENIFQCAEKFATEYELPVVRFYEDQESLGGALTAVGIILSKEIYNLASEMRKLQTELVTGLSDNTNMFLNVLNQCGLAN